MKKIIIAIQFLLLGACASLSGMDATTQSAQVASVQSCAAYGAAFATATELRSAGKLNQAQMDQVTLIDQQITPICTAPLPADPTAATQQVTAAITSLTILEGIMKASK